MKSVLAFLVFAAFGSPALADSLARQFAETIIRQNVKIPSDELGSSEWRQSISGGYIMSFALDVNADGKEEQFFTSSMNADKLICDWTVYDGHSSQKLGEAKSLRPDGFWWNSSSSEVLDYVKFGVEGGVAILSRFDKNGVTTHTESVPHEEVAIGLESGFPPRGGFQRFKPSVQICLLADIVSNENPTWRPLVLDEQGSNYGLPNGRLLLTEDAARKTTLSNFTPNDAFLAIEKLSGQKVSGGEVQTPGNRANVAFRMALIHFERARQFATSGNFKAAADELKAEAVVQKEFGGRLEFATKSPDHFFRELVELQALVTAETGSDPLAGQVGYYFGKDGNGFTAARLELSDDVMGITVPNIGDSEALALVYRLNRHGDKFVAITPKWLVVPKGELPEVLKQATREVGFDTDGRMTVRSLNAPTQSLGTDSSASPQDTSQVPALELKKPTGQKAAPSTPVEESFSVQSWMWAAVSVVILGLLWVLIKKRS